MEEEGKEVAVGEEGGRGGDNESGGGGGSLSLPSSHRLDISSEMNLILCGN